MAIWGGEGAKSRIERDLFVLGSRLIVEVQLTVVTISLTTRERRTEPGDRVRAPQSVEGIFFSICLFLFSIRFFYFFLFSLYIYIHICTYDKYFQYSSKPIMPRVKSRTGGGACPQGYPVPAFRFFQPVSFPVSFPKDDLSIHSSFFHTQISISFSRDMFIIRTKIINETGWIGQKITSTSWLLRRQSIFQGTTTYIYIYNVRLITLNCTV